MYNDDNLNVIYSYYIKFHAAVTLIKMFILINHLILQILLVLMKIQRCGGVKLFSFYLYSDLWAMSFILYISSSCQRNIFQYSNESFLE